jgi:hypothetical protein
MDKSRQKVEQKDVELITIQVEREELETMRVGQHDAFSKTDLSKQSQGGSAMSTLHVAISLLEVADKEKAKEALEKATYDFGYMIGREAAEKRGNSKDLVSYLEFEREELAKYPCFPPIEVLEQTKTRIVYEKKVCPYADALRGISMQFPDLISQDATEVAACKCGMMYLGRAEGFNPDIKLKRTSFMLTDWTGEGPRSDGCTFEVEVPE